MIYLTNLPFLIELSIISLPEVMATLNPKVFPGLAPIAINTQNQLKEDNYSFL
jgi:hypothetical protein